MNYCNDDVQVSIYPLLESRGYIVSRYISEEGNVFRFAAQQRYDFENGIVHFLKITYYPYYEEKFKVEIEDVELYGRRTVKAVTY